MNIAIRVAKPQEAEVISKIAMRSKAHWGYSEEFMQSCVDELTYSPEQLQNEAFQFAVAVMESSIVGFYALERLSQGRFELGALFVLPQHIGHGIGRTLLQHALAYVTSESGTSVSIQGDPNAERFYLTAGAKLIGTRESGSIPGRFLPLFEITL